MGRPFVHLKFATSLDGCLDDSSPQRRIFSTAEDRKEVYALRHNVDAILIGAETLRRDRPKLTLETSGGKQPARIILTASGDLPADLPLFNVGTGKRMIYTPKRAEKKVRALGLPAEIRVIGKERVELTALLEDLSKTGIQSLLVEGGAKVLNDFLAQGLFDRLRIAVAPEILADVSAPRVLPPRTPRLRLRRARALGGMTILEYDRASNR